MGLLFLGIGIIVAGIGIMVRLRHLSFMQRAEVTQGEIIEYRQRTDYRQRHGKSGSRMAHYYFPIVRYSTPDGVQEVHSKVGTSWKSHQEGSMVDVFYLRDLPEKFKLNSVADTLFFVIPTGIGIVFIGVGLLLSWVLR